MHITHRTETQTCTWQMNPAKDIWERTWENPKVPRHTGWYRYHNIIQDECATNIMHLEHNIIAKPMQNKLMIPLMNQPPANATARHMCFPHASCCHTWFAACVYITITPVTVPISMQKFIE